MKDAKGHGTGRAQRTDNDFICRFPQSQNWFVRLRDESGRRYLKSLQTNDRAVAEIVAAPHIAAHRARLLAARPKVENVWVPALEPGREHVGENGARIIATERLLIHMNHNGAIIKQEPNGGFGIQLVSRDPLTVRSLAEAFIAADTPAMGKPVARPHVVKKSNDDQIIETYITHANLSPAFAQETRSVWALFRSLCDKPLKDCSRDDGRLLVAHFQAKKLKAATMTKKIGWLVSACNLAIKERKEGDPLRLTFNPFSSIVPQPKKGDEAASEKRVPFDADDMAIIKAKLGKLSKVDQLLMRLLAASGMRLSEAFQIDREIVSDDGIRYTIIGTKSDSSERRVPFPESVLEFLPDKISGQLFPMMEATARRTAMKVTASAASKRLMKFLRQECGIKDPNKVVYSFRHRAEDQLREADCPEKMSNVLMGHGEEVTTADGYGKGYSTRKLKQWIDCIGGL